MEKKIFATITHVAEKIKEAFSGHNGDKNAHSDMRNQIEVLPDNIKKINNSDNWNAGNTKPKDYINLFKPNGARKCTDLGLPATAGYWTSVFGINNYNGDTGVTEVALTDKQNIFFRTQVGVSKMENWNGANWKEIATTDTVKKTDFNDCVKNGKYIVYFNGNGVEQHAPSNIIAGENTFAVDVTQESDNLLTQEICGIYGHSQDRKFYRVNSFGTWSKWREIAITEKIDISQCLTNGWQVGGNCNFSAMKIGNRLFIEGIVVNQSMPPNLRLAINLPLPADGRWHGGQMVGGNKTCIYAAIGPDGNLDLQSGGYAPNVYYSININYPV